MGGLGPLRDRLLGSDDLIEQLLIIVVQPFDAGIVPGGKAVHQPGTDRVDPLHLAQVDPRYRAVETVQPLGQTTQPRERQVAAESAACHRAHPDRSPPPPAWSSPVGEIPRTGKRGAGRAPSLSRARRRRRG
jgi:hypothetical protein